MNAGRSGLYARVGAGWGPGFRGAVRKQPRGGVAGGVGRKGRGNETGVDERVETTDGGERLHVYVRVYSLLGEKERNSDERTAARAVIQAEGREEARSREKERGREKGERKGERGARNRDENREGGQAARAQGREAERSKAFVQRQCAMSNHRLSHSTRHWHTTTALQPTPSSLITYSFDTQPRTRYTYTVQCCVSRYTRN